MITPKITGMMLLLIVTTLVSSSFHYQDSAGQNIQPEEHEILIVQNTSMSEPAPVRHPGQPPHEIVFALPLRDDGKIWSGKVTFTASKPIEVEVLHKYNPNQNMDEAHGEPYHAVLPGNRSVAISHFLDLVEVPLVINGTSISSGTLDFVGSALLFHKTTGEPFTVTYSVDAVAKNTTVGAGNVTTMMTNQTTDGNTTDIQFLSIQNAQSGSISEINATAYTLELKNVSDSTIAFSDRPNRIVETVSTSDFVDNWTNGPDSLALDAPNDALIVEDIQTGHLETAVIELFDPVYDMNTSTLTYTIMAENSTSIDLSSESGETVLVIDSTFINATPGDYS